MAANTLRPAHSDVTSPLHCYESPRLVRRTATSGASVYCQGLLLTVTVAEPCVALRVMATVATGKLEVREIADGVTRDDVRVR